MIRLPKAPLACALALLLVSGCAQPQKTETADPFMDKWKAKAQESKGASPAPSTAPRDVVKETAARPVDVRQDVEKPLPVKRVSLKMSNVDVSVLLRALARAADVNIILNERVTGRSNINITQAPWDQVFLGILRTHNLTYAWQGDIIRIMTADDLEEDLRRETRKRDLLTAESPVTRIVPIKFSEATKLQETAKALLTTDRSSKAIGAVLVDQHTNSLVVNALPKDINAILAVIDKLDKPTPQVLIEAFIVEANKDVARDLGVQWGGAYQISGGDRRGFVTGRDHSATTGTGTGTGTTTNSDIGSRIDPTTGNIVNLPVAGRRSQQHRLPLPERGQVPAVRPADGPPAGGQAQHPLEPVDHDPRQPDRHDRERPRRALPDRGGRRGQHRVQEGGAQPQSHPARHRLADAEARGQGQQGRGRLLDASPCWATRPSSPSRRRPT